MYVQKLEVNMGLCDTDNIEFSLFQVEQNYHDICGLYYIYHDARKREGTDYQQPLTLLHESKLYFSETCCQPLKMLCEIHLDDKQAHNLQVRIIARRLQRGYKICSRIYACIDSAAYTEQCDTQPFVYLHITYVITIT